MTFRNIAPVYKDGKLRVLPPQALMAMFSQMATGDARAPKNLRLKRSAEERAAGLRGKAAAEAAKAHKAGEAEAAPHVAVKKRRRVQLSGVESSLARATSSS